MTMAQSPPVKASRLPKGIRQRGESFMIDVTVNGVRHTATFPTLRKAKAAREALVNGALTNKFANLNNPGNPGAFKSAGPQGTQGGKSLPPNTANKNAWTLKEAYERTVAAVWADKPILTMARSHIKDAYRFFGEDVPLEAITTDRLDEYVIWLRNIRKLGNGSINRKIATVSRILRTAIERNKLYSKPLIPLCKEPQGRIRFFSEDEETKILAYFEGQGLDDHREATIIYLDTGFRVGELWQVTPQHVDLEQGTITVWKTKNGRARTLPLTSRALTIIKKRCESSSNANEPLWVGASNNWYGYVFRYMRKALGYESDSQFVPHTLRHTCCSRLVQRGVPLVHVQRWMGHNDIATTMRYAHLAPQDLHTAVKVLEPDAGNWAIK